MMIVEDSDNEQRVAAYNLVNVINISAGIIIPVTGIFVDAYGIVTSERLFLAISIISMTIMVFTRNILLKETSTGQKILDEIKENPKPFRLKDVIPFKSAAVFRGNPKAVVAVLVYVLFFIYMPLGSFNSLYFAPFMTEVLGLGKSSVSLLGGAYSAVMLVVFVFVVPVISRSNNSVNMQLGFAIQAVSLLAVIIIPGKNLIAAVLSIGVYAVGFGMEAVRRCDAGGSFGGGGPGRRIFIDKYDYLCPDCGYRALFGLGLHFKSQTSLCDIGYNTCCMHSFARSLPKDETLNIIQFFLLDFFSLRQ
jgi:hypothetical protein